MSVYERTNKKLANVIGRLNARGVTASGRFAVTLETWEAQASANKAKAAKPVHLPDNDLSLVAFDLALGEQRRFDEQTNTLKPIGDARLEIARYAAGEVPLSLEMLNGEQLEKGQTYRILIGGQRYSLVPGTVTDPADGSSFFLVLKRDDA